MSAIPLSPKELLKEIEHETGSVNAPVTPQQKIFFEQILIERIAQLVAPEDRAVTYMAVAYHRMTPEILHVLIGVPEHECESILTSLRHLSFIKPKEKQIFLLHDEMRRMIVQHWWNIQDPDKRIRRDIAKRLAQFYQKTLAALRGGEREIFQSELLGYTFLEDFHKGMGYFEGEVDKALEDGRYDQVDLLLREAEAYVQENRSEISPADVLQIEAKRVEYFVDAVRNYEDAQTMAQHALQRCYELSEWQQSELPGRFLLHQGVAELNLLRFDEAIDTLKLAKSEFYESGEDILMNEATNWIGLALYRQSKFHEAQRYWESSFGGFSSLIAAKENVEKDRRTLTQDIRFSLANLALLFGYQGKFAKAVQYAEIALDIVRSLASNDREIARMRILVSEMLALAGRRMDARHQAEQAQKLIEARELEDPMWVGRLYMTLCWLRYRNNEFRHILEIYRAEEIKDHLRFIDARDIAEAQRLLGTAIRLFEQAGLQKYLADAYYALGELEMVDPEGAHWDKAERAFEKSLEYGRKSHFLYRVIDTLESLVTLYYFRQGDGELSEDQIRKLEKYQEELDAYDPGQFPDLFGKYYITLGDVQFDKGLEALRGQGETEAALPTLLRAFSYYINAANLAEQFEEQRHYLTLRVFYNRLNTLIHLAQTGDIPSQLVELVERLQPAWERESEYFSMIYRYLMLRIQPEEKLVDIQELQEELHAQLDRGEFGLGSLLNDCALVAYRSLIFSKTLAASGKDRYRTQYILSCARQSRIYRALGDEYQAQQYLGFAQHELPYVTDEFWQIELSGYLACSEGTLEYRRGEYGKMLEFYLKEELPVAQGRFERQYPGARQRALSILLDAEKRLQMASEGAAADYRRTRHDRDFGEACYRLGELLMLNGQFEDSPEMPGALTYLKLAVENSKDKSTYFYLNSLQSYATALYFAGDDSQQRKERLEYEQRFLDEYQTARRKYPSLMGRLRITQGDALFSEHFYQQTDPNTKKLRRKYKPRHSTINPRILRIMLRYYVEACNWMAQHSHTDLAGAIRVLQQRIQFISDRESLLIVQQGLGNIWGDQEYLRDKSDELETLIQFARIRSMILADEDNH